MMPEHLTMIEFTESLGGRDRDMVAMFNSEVIHPDRVASFIKRCGSSEYHAGIVFMTTTQYENLKDPVVNDDAQMSLLEDLLAEQKEQM
jgi:hypothetical protein